MEHVQNSVKRPISTNWKPIQWLSEAFRVPSIPSWWDWLPRGWGKRSQAETSYFFHVSWNRGDSQILVCKRLLGQGMPRDIICKGRQGGGAATTLALPPADGHLEGHGGHRAMEPISDMGHVAKSWMIWIDMVGKNSLPDLARSCQILQECLNCIELSDLDCNDCSVFHLTSFWESHCTERPSDIICWDRHCQCSLEFQFKAVFFPSYLMISSTRINVQSFLSIMSSSNWQKSMLRFVECILRALAFRKRQNIAPNWPEVKMSNQSDQNQL